MCFDVKYQDEYPEMGGKQSRHSVNSQLKMVARTGPKSERGVGRKRV